MGEASGAGRRPERAGEGGGEGAVACSSSAPGTGLSPASHLPPPAAAALSSPLRTARSGLRAGKAPSEVRAEPPARLEITPRPPGAPPPAWAPPRGGGGGGGGGGGRAGRGSLQRSAGPSRELAGAAPTRALRLPRPAPRAARFEGAAAGRGPTAAGVEAVVLGAGPVSRGP